MGELELTKVSPGEPQHRDLVALDRHFDVRCDSLSQRIDALEEGRVPLVPMTAYTELHNRMAALEKRLPQPIPVVTPLAPRCPCEDGSLCALVPGSKAHPWPVCVRCSGPVEPDRYFYAHPTCYRCLPPPEPLPIVQLAPYPDYRTAEPIVDGGVVHFDLEGGTPSLCSCEESVELRRLLGEASARLADLGERLRRTDAPIPMLLTCPSCGARHIDEGEFATKPHHTHACQHCGHCWRVAIAPTCGVQFLPGFKNAEAKP